VAEGAPPELLDAGLPAPARGVFTTRAGGVSPAPWDTLNLALHVEDEQQRVLVNRERLAGALGGLELVFAQQVHGAGVAVVEPGAGRPVDGAADGAVDGVDALVTRSPQLGLVVLAADCLPVLLADPGAGVVAAVHAGRQGLLAGVLQSAVLAMAGLGAAADRVRAVVGPAAGPCCYEVPPEMAGDAERALPGVRSRTRHGTASLDLRAGAQRALAAAGVVAVAHVAACTIDDARFYSYRRDGRTGRHAGLVWLAS
jgi:polyphenol oxidase